MDEHLSALGLTAAEEAAYELLVRRPATTDELLTAWPHAEPAVLEALAALEAKGIIHRKANRFHAVAPDAALGALLLDQEDQLQRARQFAGRLADRYQRARVIEVVTGPRATLRLLERIHRDTQHQVRSLGRPPSLAALPEGIPWRAIDTYGATAHPGQDLRELPSLPIRLYLSDDRQAVVLSPSQSLLIHPSSLLDALGHLFEELWHEATSAADRTHLVTLLLSGLTDQAIARQLGIGYRTAQRRIAALISDLGVRSRFQAGVQVALHDP